jgi:hypothetical protein
MEINNSANCDVGAISSAAVIPLVSLIDTAAGNDGEDVVEVVLLDLVEIEASI